MANLIDLLQGQLSEGLLDQLSNQLGGTDKEQTQDAASGIISAMVSALSKNASTPSGADALANALERDHDGSILDDIMGYAGGSAAKPEYTQDRMTNGAGILKHVLGAKQGNMIEMISKMSGLANGQTGNLMTMLAPIVMGMLGKQRKQQNLDQGGLADILSRSVQSQTNKRQEMGFIGKLLDQDGDGSIMDDLANLGMKFLRRR